MIPKMFSGRLLDVIIVVTPAPVAISAAMSFVSIPPVPRLDPKVVVLTVVIIIQASYSQGDSGQFELRAGWVVIISDLVT